MSRGRLPVARPAPKQVEVSRPSAGGGRPLVGYGIKWLGVPLGLATLQGACFDRGICLGVVICAVFTAPAAHAESLPDALAKAYQTNPQLNAERARQRATDENVPQALAGYRPQIVASLSAGLQAVRNLLPDNTVQSASLKPWTIGVTVTQTLFNGFKTANSVRVAELQVQSGREALRNVGQGVLLDAVTAYTNVLANQSLVTAQRANVAFLKETLGITQKRLNAGDVTPTDTAQAEARLSRGLADLNGRRGRAPPSARRPMPMVIGNPPTVLSPPKPWTAICRAAATTPPAWRSGNIRP